MSRHWKKARSTAAHAHSSLHVYLLFLTHSYYTCTYSSFSTATHLLTLPRSLTCLRRYALTLRFVVTVAPQADHHHAARASKGRLRLCYAHAALEEG